jgi:hypothetical protein
MQKTTQDTVNPGKEDSAGLPVTKAEPMLLRPWEIAEKLLPIENEQAVSVEYASDDQFQAWILANGIPVDEDGIPEWSFDDRCGVIMHALSFGLLLTFADENNSPKNSDSELLEGDTSASEAV